MNCVIVSSVIQLKYVCVVHSSDVLCGNIVPNPLLWKSFVKRMFLDVSSGLVWSFWTSQRTHYPAGRFWLSFTSRMEVMEEFCKKSIERMFLTSHRTHYPAGRGPIAAGP